MPISIGVGWRLRKSRTTPRHLPGDVTKMVKQLLVSSFLLTAVICTPAAAQHVVYYSPMVTTTASLVVVASPIATQSVSVPVINSLPVYATARPITTVVQQAPASVVTYRINAPVTTTYRVAAPAATTCCGHAAHPATTTYRVAAPAVTAYSVPVAAPMVTAYSVPVAVARTKYYYPGQPVRNFLRAITP